MKAVKQLGIDDEVTLEKMLRELESVDSLNRSQPEFIAAVLGAGTGSVVSLGLLSVLGTSGLSAVGITSGLSAAGALLGGGMLSGMLVLSAPIAGLAVAGWSWKARNKRQRVHELQQKLLQELLRIQSETLAALECSTELSTQVIQALECQLHEMDLLIRQLRLRLAQYEAK